MELKFWSVILLCFVCSSATIDVNNGLDTNMTPPVTEEVQQYILRVVSMMAAKQSVEIEALKEMHNIDIAILKTRLDAQEEKINALEKKRSDYSNNIQELKNRFRNLEGNCECDETYDELRHAEEKPDVYKKAMAKEVRKDTKRFIRRGSVENRVAFFATMTSATVHLGKDQDIVFDHVVTNIGNAYNGNHGTFVAPAAGTYVFCVTLYHQDGVSSAGTWGHVIINGAVVAKLHVNQEQSSQTVVVNLQVGDDVSIQNTEPDRGFYGDRYTTFSGFLLYEGIFSGTIVG